MQLIGKLTFNQNSESQAGKKNEIARVGKKDPHCVYYLIQWAKLTSMLQGMSFEWPQIVGIFYLPIY